MKFHEMTSGQLKAVDRSRSIVLAPIAAVEQHGPHLPTGTDTIICGAVSEAVEAKRKDSVLLLPTLWLGASAHHLRFGATLSANLDTYVSMLCEIARQLLEDGFERILFLNGHGGNVDPLKVALRELQLDDPRPLLAGGSYWSVAEKVIADGLEGKDKAVGHACEFETSMIMHLRPELVDTPQLADAGFWQPDLVEGLFVSRDMKQRTKAGCTGRPDLATPEKGAAMFEGIVGRVCEAVDTLLAAKLGDNYEDLI